MLQRWIKLSEWARRRGVSRMTAWRMANAGDIEGACKNAAGRWIVPVADGPRLVVAYCRVSGHGQRADLDRQVARIAEWAAANGVTIDRYVREIGSGLNENRKEFNRLLADEAVRTIIVEHRERLARFGVTHLERVLKVQGRSIRVLEEREVDDDLVQDMTDLLASFAARLYGRRGARNRARRAARAMADEAKVPA